MILVRLEWLRNAGELPMQQAYADPISYFPSGRVIADRNVPNKDDLHYFFLPGVSFRGFAYPLSPGPFF